MFQLCMTSKIDLALGLLNGLPVWFYVLCIIYCGEGPLYYRWYGGYTLTLQYDH